MRRQALTGGAALAVAALVAVTGPAPARAACRAIDPPAYATGGAPGTGTVNDPLFAMQWSLAQIRAPAAWAHGFRGAGALIAVVDTGVDLHHPDLEDRLAPGVDLTVAAGADDCPAGPNDENGHGTHVAGIAAATADNGIGVAGVAPAARVMAVRVLDAEGAGTATVIAQGIRYAADQGADVINLSIVSDGTTGALGPAYPLTDGGGREIAAAVEHAWQRGAVVVAAAGNAPLPLCSHPAAEARAICVGATDPERRPTYYSSLPVSPALTGLRAPGGAGAVSGYGTDGDGCAARQVLSTIWPKARPGCFRSPGYDALSGTSMAAPHVSGVAALLAGAGLSNEQIVERLHQTSSNHGRYDPVMGYGIVNAEAATEGLAPPPPPSPPPPEYSRDPGSQSPRSPDLSPMPPATDPPAQDRPGARPAPACASARRRQRRAQRAVTRAQRTLARARSTSARRAAGRRLASSRAALRRAESGARRACRQRR